MVGASLAGVSAARALRAQGYDGAITVVGEESHAPYDRPPLSKTFLAGTTGDTDLALVAADEDLDVDWRLGVSAVQLHPARGSVELSDGSELVVDGVVAATGARPRLPWSAVPAGVHVLRTLDDALALRAELRPGARLVVVGAGFVGAEVASTAHSLGVDVTVVEATAAPLSAALGTSMGAVVGGLHAEHGVRLLTGVGVGGFAGADHVEAVELADGRSVPADVVVVGVGVQPNLEWLSGTALDVGDGVACDAYGATGIPNVVAVGDCATWHDPELGAHQRLEHWTAARERGPIAVTTLLTGGAVRVKGRGPYFWSDQYEIRVQFAGRAQGADSVLVEEGSLDDRDFLAVYRRGGVPIGVLALGQPRSFMRWRKRLAGARTLPTPPSALMPAG